MSGGGPGSVDEAIEVAQRLRSRDPARAFSAAEWAASQGDPRGQALAARIVLDLPGTGAADVRRAQEWIAAATDAGEWVSPIFASRAEARLAAEGLSDAEWLDRCIRRVGLESLRDEIYAAALPSVRLIASRAETDDALAMGAAKLGGAPDAQDDFDWPVVGDVPLSFVGQFVRDGRLLLFFYDVAAQPWGPSPELPNAWAVRAVSDDAAGLMRNEPPPGVQTFHPCVLSERTELTIPFSRTREARDLLGEDDTAWQAYSDLLSMYPVRPPITDGRVHRSGGHPDAIQGDMPRRIESDLRGGVDLDAETPELDEAAAGWRLLFQVDSEPQAGMQWGGDGRLFFWVREDDLRGGRFEDVQIQLQTG